MPNYKSDSNSQGLFFPVILSEQLLKGTVEYSINEIINNDIDIRSFESKYTNSFSGRKAYHPKTLLKIILLAYSKRIYSSREIKLACKTNIQFIAISGNVMPDHSTIAAFISSMHKEILGIFTSHGRKMYSRRMSIVEPVFADITFHKRLNYFTLRTKKKVNTQWLLFCCVHNIGKIAAK